MNRMNSATANCKTSAISIPFYDVNHKADKHQHYTHARCEQQERNHWPSFHATQTKNRNTNTQNAAMSCLLSQYQDAHIVDGHQHILP